MQKIKIKLKNLLKTWKSNNLFSCVDRGAMKNVIAIGRRGKEIEDS